MEVEGIAGKLSHLIKLVQDGTIPQELLLAIGVLSLLLLLLLMRLARRSSGPMYDEGGFDRLSAMLGRMEKLEITINEMKSNTSRAIELFRGDVGYVKQELAEIRKAIGSKGGTTPPSGGGGGGGGEEPSRERRDTTEMHQVDRESVLKTDAVQTQEAPVEQSSDKHTAQTEAAPETLAKRLTKSRLGFFARLKRVFSLGSTVNSEMLDELEALLIESDLGVKATNQLLTDLRTEASAGSIVDEEALRGMLKAKLVRILETGAPPPFDKPQRREDGPVVVMVVGVNGVGKTTTVAKLAHRWKEQGSRVMVVAADTFRAAADAQLSEWGARIGVDVVTGEPGSKPATVVFDAMAKAMQGDVDVVIIDTAGRLHTKTNLMQELEGVRNILAKHQPSAPHETLLIVDGATGQNALSQAQEFNTATPLSGLIVTKLDGTPKGGIVVAIKQELNVPIRFIGVGESRHDLRTFSPRDFVEAIFDTSDIVTLDNEQPSAHGETRRRRRRESGSTMMV